MRQNGSLRRPPMRMLAIEEKARVGRPANPESRRMHVWVEPTVKRRIVRAAEKHGVPLQQVVGTALREYLTKLKMK
jgi:predicted HicB family RNase H-like nuclease